MKLIQFVLYSLLSIPIAANDSVITSSNHGLKGVTTTGVISQEQQGRQLRMIPTLLSEIMNIRTNFDFFDELFANFLFGQAPSDAPSMTPSDVPTMAPSDTPVTAPSTAPSAAKLTWNDGLGGDSYNIETCPYDPKPFENTSSTLLTIMYAYQIELTSNAEITEVTKQIEALLQTKLAAQICITGTDTLGITSESSSRLGALCQHSAGDGPCYVMAGRLTLLVALSALSDKSEIYCEFLETIRAFLSGGTVPTQVAEVVALNSTILDSLVPTFCTMRQGKDISSLAGEGESTNGPSDRVSKMTVLPITIGCVVCAIAAAAALLIYRWRSATTPPPIPPCRSSGSDLYFENSDESESRRDDWRLGGSRPLFPGELCADRHVSRARNPLFPQLVGGLIGPVSFPVKKKQRMQLCKI